MEIMYIIDKTRRNSRRRSRKLKRKIKHQNQHILNRKVTTYFKLQHTSTHKYHLLKFKKISKKSILLAANKDC